MNDRDDRSREEGKSALPPAPPSRGRDQAIWVGFFLVIGLVATLGALFILTDAALFRGRYVVYTTVPDAGGIRKSDPVQMRGVNIGRVLRFKIGEGGVEIQLEIEGEYTISKDSTVRLTSAGLLGGMVAEVIPGTSKEMAKWGDRLPGVSEAGLADSTSRIAGQAEDALKRVQDLLSPALIQDVHGSGADLRQVLQQLSATVGEQRAELRTLSATLRRSASGVERITTGPELDHTLKRIDTLGQRMDDVGASLIRSTKALEDTMQRVERGEGTLGRLAKDETIYKNLEQASTGLKDTIQNVNKATDDLRSLMDDIKKNPRKYFKFSVF
jgi:phospholipid/cholesterol/gamma-HCH transport system substrate-binding protein